jgi:hypothetical protein
MEATMRTLRFALPATILLLGAIVSTTASYAKPEYARKEGKSCTFCHVRMGSKDLNNAGKYYKDHNHSLEGYKPA